VIAHLVQQGEWRFTDFRGQQTTAASAGELCIRYNDPPWEFEIDPATRAQVLQLPAEELRPHIGDQAIVISRTAPEVRILTAYVSTLIESLNELNDAAVGHARNAVIELFKGMLAHRVVADEPQLATALVAAAKQLAQSRLLDGDLNPRALAKALNVSVRTLHRAFAAADESIMSFVRAQRLERARLELTAPGAPLSVAEVAVRWQFSDNSHFTRAFRQRYGVTPTQYVRRAPSPSGKRPVPAPGES
jgi:AraC family transcriptional activator of tynA and feaB